jgi:Swi5
MTLTHAQQRALSESQSILDNHIKLLKRYNELRDVGMMMVGVIAEREGRVVGDVLGRMGMSSGPED